MQRLEVRGGYDHYSGP